MRTRGASNQGRIPSPLTTTALRHAEDTLGVRIPMAARALWLIRNGQLTELDAFMDRPREAREQSLMTDDTVMSIWHGIWLWPALTTYMLKSQPIVRFRCRPSLAIRHGSSTLNKG